MAAPVEYEVVHVSGHDVQVSNPRKVLFPDAGHTKLDLARYYLAVADGALRAAGGRPNMLLRFPNGIDGESFYQKRAPESRPPWVEVVELSFPSGRTAQEVVPRDAATLVWMANLACLELHPHPVRAEDLEHPDELRIDLDPVPGVTWTQVREVAGVVRATLADLGLVGWPKTSGSRGIHIYVRIEPRWTFAQVRRAALALRPRGRAARAGAGHEQVVEGGTPRRVPRLQPEREGSDHGRRLFGAAQARCARVGAARLGRSRGLRAGGLHAGDDARRASPRLATAIATSIAIRPASTRCSSSRRGRRKRGRATRPGLRTTASSPVKRRGSRRRSGACRSIR